MELQATERDESSVLAGIGLVAVLALSSYVVGDWMASYAREWLRNDRDYPNKCREACVVFSGPFEPHSCNSAARGVFLLLTGVDPYGVDYMKRDGGGHTFDEATVGRDNRVRMLSYVWNTERGSPNARSTTNDCHSLVHYKGFLYQAYREARYVLWGHRVTALFNGYPLVRMPLTAELNRLLTETPEKLSVSQFNDWCAPSGSPLPGNIALRLGEHFEAAVDPARAQLSLPLKWC